MSEIKIKDAFCKNLIALRKQKSLKQTEVAAALGISDKTYSKWETGETDPGLSSVIQLTEYFGVSISQLFDAKSYGSCEQIVDSLMNDLSPAETIEKSFEIQFYSIRGLAKRALHNPLYHKALPITPPENRVNKKNSHAITAFASEGVYEMMYNGSDANISVSLLPNEEKNEWLKTEQPQISKYLSLIGNMDFLRLLPFMIDCKFAEKYTADYISRCANINLNTAKEILNQCVALNICSQSEVHIGNKMEKLFRTEADQMLVAILTLTHLCIPTAEKNGCYYFNMPAKQIMVNGEVN